MASDVDFGGKTFILAGLLDALARTVVLPAVVQAADAVAFHPASGELRAAVGAAEVNQMGRALLAAIERELLAHHLDRARLASGKVTHP